MRHMDHVPEAPIRLGREPLGVRPQAVDRNLNRLLAGWSIPLSRTRPRDCKLRSEPRNLWHCDTCSPEIELQHTVANRGVASHSRTPKNLHKFDRFFFHSPKWRGKRGRLQRK